MTPPIPPVPPLIGVLGRKRSGKDTFANVLVADYGFTKAGFADPLREAALALNPIVGHGPLPGDLHHWQPRRYADVLEALGYERAKDLYPEVRSFLQRLGTDAIRALDEGFWTRMAEQRMDARKAPLVFTDVRFPNEAEAIRKRGGYLVRVERAGLPDDGDTHPSEVALDGYPVNLVLHNDGPLESFIDAVGAMGPHLRYLYTYPRA